MKTLIKYTIVALFPGLISLATLPASSALIPVDLATAGDQKLTRDTVAGLDWLDLTETVGQSYDTVVAGFGGYYAAGFVHATVSQVTTLFGSTGFTNIDGGFSAADFAPAVNLLALMGQTSNSQAQGIADFDVFSATQVELPVFGTDLGSQGRALTTGAPTGGPIPKANSNINVGNFLVRPVPVPAGLAFMASGFVAALLLTRKDRRA